jgi:hypothetical protein
MRWLLLKDLQILRRSPLVTALLVIYPIVIAVLIGFALSRGPEKPRIAFLNQIPADQELSLGEGGLDKAEARSELCSRVECVDVSSEQEARDKVESGDVLGALIVPPDLIERLQSLTSLNPSQPVVKVLVNEEDPVKAGLVNDRIDSLVSEANLRVSGQVEQTSLTYLDLLLRGGRFDLLGQSFEVLGLTATQQILEAVKANGSLDPGLEQSVDRVIRFAKLARQNLDLAKPLLSSIAHPIEVDKDVVSGSPPSLDTFAIAVAATFTLMFVTVLLVAGSLALEREENAYARVTRGLVGPTGLLTE